MIRISEPAREYEALASSIETETLAILRSGRWLLGKATDTFAESFASYVGVRNVIPVANGTDALELALRAVGVRQGDEVVTAANAGGYASIACRLIGAVPVYADIRLPTMTVDPDEVMGLLSSKVKAVVMTHLYGNMCDVDNLRHSLEEVGRTDVAILEDCAQAHGAKRSGKAAGSVGDIGVFSFYPSKNLGALGDAGAVVTDRDDLAETVRLLHQYGWEHRYSSIVPYGRNSRIDEVQAAILNVKLCHLDEMNDRRRAILQRYRSALPGDYLLCASEGEANVGHLAVLLCPDRSEAARHLHQSGIQTDVHYPILDCDQPAWSNLPMRSGILVESRTAVARVLTVPCFPFMSGEEIQTVCSALETLPSTGLGHVKHA